MAYSEVLPDIKRRINLQKSNKMPVIALSEEFDVAQAGISYERYSNDAKQIARVHSEAIQRFGYDWACVYVDDCLEFEPMGVQTVGENNIPKSVSVYLPFNEKIVENIKIPNPLADGRMPLQLEALSRLRQEYGDTILLCGRTPAPFSAVTLLFGIEAVMTALYDDPELLKKALDILCETEINYAKAQKSAGAHALWVGDCSASSRFISGGHYTDFAFPYAKKLVEEIKRLDMMSIYFSAEYNSDRAAGQALLKPDILALSEDADMRVCYGSTCLMGNIDPIKFLLYGSPAQIQKEVARVGESMEGYPGWLINTGEGIPRETPAENVAALVEAIKILNI